MNKLVFSFALASILSFAWVSAQAPLLRQNQIKFVEAGDTLKNPFAGGMNAVQFSTMDMDGDSDEDLFIFDRSGSMHTLFRNNGTIGVADYTFMPEWYSYFPDHLVGWVLLRDYNCDSRKDLFASSKSGPFMGVQCYRNISLTGPPVFVLEKFLLNSDYGLGQVPLGIGEADVPALDDMDGDGDLDFLTFNSGGSMLEWHKNQSKELYGHCDSLVFVVADACWGKVEESGSSNDITLGISCRPAPGGDSSSATTVHAGSTLLTFDEEEDGDKEVIIGDLLSLDMVYLHNDGTPTSALVDSVDASWPSYDSPVDMQLFPGAYMFDADNDNFEDIVVAPNIINVSYDLNNVWLYSNQLTAPVKSFSLSKTSFLQEEMVDVGTSAYPAFLDYNADGLKDLVIGNLLLKDGPAIDGSRLTLYRNAGTASLPVYELVTRDFAGTASAIPSGKWGFSPAFGDLDGDGDTDMLVGDTDGEIHLFTNSAGAGNPVSYSLTTMAWEGIDIGQYATPQLVDLNKDNLLDLVVGEYGGTLNYFQNTGSVFVPDFPTTPTNAAFGKIDTRIPCCSGNSTPWIIENAAGEWELLVGSEDGFILHYGDLADSILSGSFTLIDSTFNDIEEGQRIGITAEDITNDGLLEFVVGNYRGGISIYGSDSVVIGLPQAMPAPKSFILSPNPGKDELTLWSSDGLDGNCTIQFLTLQGTVVHQDEIGLKSSRGQVHGLDRLAPGIYIVQIQMEGRNPEAIKWVKL